MLIKTIIKECILRKYLNKMKLSNNHSIHVIYKQTQKPSKSADIYLKSCIDGVELNRMVADMRIAAKSFVQNSR